MEMKDKRVGYSQKTILIAIGCVIISGIIFYAGAKYEKHKLSALGLLKNGNESCQAQPAKKGKNNTPPAENNTEPTNADQNAVNSNQAPVPSNTTPAAPTPNPSSNTSTPPSIPGY